MGLGVTRGVVVVLFVLTVLSVSPARAALCSNDMWGGRTADIQATSTLTARVGAQTNISHLGSHPLCQGDVYARAKLIGMTANCESTDASDTHTTSGAGGLALVQKTCSGLQYSYTYHGGGIHWGFGESQHYSESPGSVSWTPPPEEVDDDLDSYSEVQGDCNDADASIYPGANPDCQNTNVDKNCDGIEDITQCGGSPIVLDLTGKGFDLTSAADGVAFDLFGNGDPVKIAWTAPTAEDAWLCLDRNGNGVVDSGRELFGNATPQPASNEPHGFVALAEFDRPSNGGNGDGIIDVRDSVFNALRLWQDRNHDGISQPDELMRLQDGGIAGLSLEVHEANRRDRHGNVFRYRAKVIRVAPQGPGPWAYDVYLRIER